jgi:8-oxo-dGTP diphosphatase
MVAAGVIEKDDLLLICQRRKGDRHAMKWEFPGGKVEPGETPRQALERELKEELAIEAVIGNEMVRYEHTYPKGKILLIFYRVARYEGRPVNRVFEQIRWEERRKLREYDFLDGDFDFIRRLTRGEFNRLFRPAWK